MKIPPIRQLARISSAEMAFTRWHCRRALGQAGFHNLTIQLFDFLHPLTPSALIPAIQTVGQGLEQIPVIREIAGSFFVQATKS